MVTRAFPQPAWSLVRPRLAPRTALPRAQARDDRGAFAAAARVLVDALDGHPSSREAWMLQVAAGVDEAARLLAVHAPAAPCARRAAGVLIAVGSGQTRVRLLREVRALQALVGDPGLRRDASTAGVRHRVLRLSDALTRYAAAAHN